MDRQAREAWKAADAILDALLDLPLDQREAHLQALAPAPEVAARVRRLLAGSASEGPLDRPLPPLDPLEALEPATEPSLEGRRLGRWRLQELLGEGGMAVVYRAISAAPPLGQQAALKILSLAALARGGRERFLREQSVLARLRHPYIAALYEAGVDDDGTPWLAMALVEGQRIDQWCQARGLGLSARLDLVGQVAEALEYAHRNLVVHRDIKPSNVLVDEDGLVRLLDFGIGRELSSAATRTMQHALTPEYAAPEQFDGQDTGTAADVYGLAALTYRLLTGSAPHDALVVRAHSPERPSTRAAHAPAGSLERGFAPRLRGDLDAILLRGLAQDPAQRYPSVEALVADLRNYRARRPVRARAPSAGYRLRRFAQRNRWPLAAGAVLALSLLGGGLGVFWQAQRAERAAQEAQLQLRYLDSLLREMAPSTAEARQPDRSRLIASAAAHARQDLASQSAALATVLLTLAEIAQAAGEHGHSAQLAAEAAGLRDGLDGRDSPGFAEALVVRGRALWSDRNLGGDPEALAEQALAILERKAPDSEAHMRALLLQQQLDQGLDRAARAKATGDRMLGWCRARDRQPVELCGEVLLAVASLQDRQGYVREAERTYTELIELEAMRAGGDHARTLQVRTRHARAVLRLGDAARAAALLEPVLAAQLRIYDGTTPELAATRGALAESLTTLGDFARARELHEAQLAELVDQRGSGHPDVAAYLGNFGVFLMKAGDFEGALARLAECAAGYATLGGPDHAGVHVCNGNRADVLREMGRAAEAEPLSRAALKGIRDAFGEDSPLLAPRYSNLGRVLLALGRDDEALPVLDRARAAYAARGNPMAALMRLHAVEARVRSGRVPPARGWDQAQAARRQLEAGFPTRNPMRIAMLAPLARIACRAPLQLPCAAQRDEALTAMAQPTSPADARRQIDLALQATAQAAAGTRFAGTGQ
ncbi:serine/threonine protein kinase [Luteimonas viscosa]|uniref:Serine/threonine protein kinase n=1 Tax=Luteimonas viscosa TaxID=1132694 RepID=A0A5D4XPK8_9GAMM|nr:serine/threonine-protein kinase [Luteimonas viscosa]TYT26519.1 serine/threonine protein kinase [Luteimonas viscosa]